MTEELGGCAEAVKPRVVVVVVVGHVGLVLLVAPATLGRSTRERERDSILSIASKLYCCIDSNGLNGLRIGL